MKKIILAISLLVIFLIYIQAQSQDALQKLKDQYESGVITQEEAIQQAKYLGISQSDIDRATMYYTGKRESSDALTAVKSTKNDSSVVKSKSTNSGVKPISNAKIVYDEAAQKIQVVDIAPVVPQGNGLLSPEGYYGYGLFRGTPDKFQQSETGPVDPNYRIGPGDEVIVSVWGDVEFRNTLTVSRDGTVVLDKAGLISVNGLSLKELEAKLANVLSKVYSTISGGYPSTFIDVSLGKLKPITVFFVGEVKNPGAYQLDSYSTAFSALYNIGGPKIDGSLRKIQIIRDGKTISELDLYAYLLTGKKVKDIRLQHNDNIFIPPRESTITLKGEVLTPAIFELLKDETLADLIKYAGSLKAMADLNRVQIERIVSFEKRKDTDKILDVQDYKLALFNNNKTTINPIKMTDRDVVTIFPLLNPQKGWTSISGAIFRPGKYSIEKNMTVRKLINTAQGLMPDAYPDKADLTRNYLDGTTEHISVDLNSNQADTLKLIDFDELKIYSRWEVKKKDLFVEISGHITNPGKYVLRDSMRIADLLFKAGGLNDEYFKKQTYLIRADLVRYNEDELTTKVIPIKLDSLLTGSVSNNLILRHRDRVEIYDSSVLFFPQTVRIQGAVKKPGEYDLQTNMSLHDLLLRANGFNKNAYMYEVDVYRVDPYNFKPDSMAIKFSVKIDPTILESFKTISDFKLEDKDYVVVREHPDFQYQHAVVLRGAVKFPGTYIFLHKNETFKEIITRAGGLKDDAFIDGITLRRSNSRVGADFDKILYGLWGNHDISLKDGDEINIPIRPNTVKVQGFVNNPCLIQYRPDWSLQDYIDAAGGYREEEKTEKTSVMVTYASGLSQVDKWYWSPGVKEGAVVTVNSKISETKSSIEYLKEWTSIAGSAATAIVAILLLSR